MEKSNKRGKIPQSDWPLIMTRYEAGETLASIARTYDCSPPAISYVVSKMRSRQQGRYRVQAGTGDRESQLVKGIASEPTAARYGGRSRPEVSASRTDTDRGAPVAATSSDIDGSSAPRRLDLAQRGPQPTRAPAPPGTTNGKGAPVGSAQGGPGQRSTASWPLSRNDADPRSKPQFSVGNNIASQGGSSDSLMRSTDRPTADRPAATDIQLAPPAVHHPRYPIPSRPEAAGFSEAGSPPGRPLRSDLDESTIGAAVRKEAPGSFIDEVLRARVKTDIASFLGAFDAAMAEDTQENRLALRDATDRLLRAGARTRIELERLEARVPLASPNHAGGPGAWRDR